MSYFKYDSHSTMNKICTFRDDDLQKIAKDFLGKYKLMPYEYGKWYKKAYNVVNLIIKRKANSNKEWQHIALLWEKKNDIQLKEDIFSILKELTVAEIIDTIGKLADKYDLPVGIIQKIVSLLIKYIFCYYVAFGGGSSSDVVNTFPWIEDKSVRDQLPIPVDSRILYSLYTMGTTELEITVLGKYAKIRGIPWTRIELGDYEKIQKVVSKLSAQHRMSPLEFEMKKLWE